MPEVPFIALEDARSILGQLGLDPNASAYAITSTDQNGVISWTREQDNGSKVVFDFTGKTVTFSSFEAFSEMPYAATPLDPVSLANRDGSNNPLYIKHAVFHKKD